MKPLLLPLFLLWTAALSAQALQPDAVLTEMHKRLASSEKRTYHNPVVFIGEITKLGAVFQGVCKSGVNQEVEFTISRVLWGDHSEPVLRTGYINCTRQPLPSPPFTLHAKVIVYCEQARSAKCLAPVAFTDDRLHTVESWIAAIPHH